MPGAESLGTGGQTEAVGSLLLDLEGKPFDLWATTAPKATVVVFTRSDCPISNRLAPEVHRLHDQFTSQGVRFYLIYVDPDESPESVRRHLEEYGYRCAALRDPEHWLVKETSATVTPEAVVFDTDENITYRGRINDQYVDFGKARAAATTHDLADAIAATLAGEPVATPVTKAVGCYISDLE